MRVSYVIVFVSNMATSHAFYRDILGLPLRLESPGWTEFATEGATLALHKAEGPRTSGENGTSEPAGQCRPGLEVPDLEAFHRRRIEQDVRCTREPTSVLGARLAQYADPDGLAISVGEARNDGARNR